MISMISNLWLEIKHNDRVYTLMYEALTILKTIPKAINSKI